MGAQEGEWCQVKRKKGRLHTITPEAQNDLRLPNPSPELSADDLRRYHGNIVHKWLQSEWWKKVLDTWEQALNKSSPPVITTAVCLGPGPFEPKSGNLKMRLTAHIQTAVFCSLVDHLSGTPQS